MNSLSSIFKKKKKDQPTPVLPRKIEEVSEKNEEAKETQDNKSTSESVESSSEEAKSNKMLKPRVSTSNRSSFLSTASG